jgi:aryl-alcohol dehydrogenase-like predicted oxidoreductase
MERTARRGDGLRRLRLGDTGLEVSALAFGTWAFGGDWGSFDPREGRASIHRALELGIDIFDTAQAYGFGTSERLLGEALRGAVRREDVIIATKGGLRKEGDLLLRDASPAWLRRGAEESLKHLGIEYIDLYQVHWPDPNTPAEATAAALGELREEGKVRHVGVSNYDVKQMEGLRSAGALETLQPPYHMFHRDIEEEILTYTAEHGIGVLAYGPLAHGLLSGRMTTESSFPADDWRSGSADFRGEPFRANLRVVERLEDFARERGVSLPQLAVAWTIAHPAVHVAIVGARRPAQLEDTAPAADLVLGREDLAEIDRILSPAVPVTGPFPEME